MIISSESLWLCRLYHWYSYASPRELTWTSFVVAPITSVSLYLSHNVGQYVIYQIVFSTTAIYSKMYNSIVMPWPWTTKAFLPIHFSAGGPVKFTIIEVSMGIESKSFYQPGSLNPIGGKIQIQTKISGKVGGEIVPFSRLFKSNTTKALDSTVHLQHSATFK